MLLVLLGSSSLASSQESDGRPHFVLKIGAAFDQGDFGTSETSRALYTPLTLRYLGDRFDLSVTPSLAWVDTPGGVGIIDGVPTFSGSGFGAESGMGDTVIRARFFLHEEWRSRSGFPSITPFVKVKLPTSRDTLNLGTGATDYGLGIQWDKELASILLFGDVGYTVIGKVSGLNLRSRPDASFGIGGRLSDRVTVAGLLDWRESIIVGNQSLSELVGLLTYRVSPTLSVSPNAFVGLTGGTSDFGLGVEFALRFGRY